VIVSDPKSHFEALPRSCDLRVIVHEW